MNKEQFNTLIAMALFYCSFLKRRKMPACDNTNEIIAKSYYCKGEVKRLSESSEFERFSEIIEMQKLGDTLDVQQMGNVSYIYLFSPFLRKRIEEFIFKKIIEKYYDKNIIDEILAKMQLAGDVNNL